MHRSVVVSGSIHLLGFALSLDRIVYRDASASKRTQSFLQLIVFSDLGFCFLSSLFHDFGWHPSVSLSIAARSNHRAILALSLCRIAYRDNIAFKKRSKDFLQSVLPGFVNIRTCFVSCVVM